MSNSIRDRGDDLERLKVLGDQLNFQGNIIDGDCERFKAAINSHDVMSLVVNSQGGSVRESLCIADLLKIKKIDKLIVRGVCWSSCANYLFLGVKDRTIERGTVGFHGNTTALLNQKGVAQSLSKLFAKQKMMDYENKKLRAFLDKSESSEPLSKNEVKVLKRVWETYLEEQKFLQSRQLPQPFFELTQQADKGSGAQIEYLFLIPSARALRSYGVMFNGEQDEEFVRRFNEKSPAKLLYQN